MSKADQDMFLNAMEARKKDLWGSWNESLGAFNRLAMFDMLPALAALSTLDRNLLHDQIEKDFSGASLKRARFAMRVVDRRDIPNFDIPEEQVNDGREYLGCTRLTDNGVQERINTSLDSARQMIREGSNSVAQQHYWADGKYQCCTIYKVAWLKVLVPLRQKSGNSLISDLAAAAHYMLCRYHVCMAMCRKGQMEEIIDSYDSKKEFYITLGNKDATWSALTGNRPFPVDFGIRRWAYQGAADGEQDRRKCNSHTSLPIIPEVNGSEY